MTVRPLLSWFDLSEIRLGKWCFCLRFSFRSHCQTFLLFLYYVHILLDLKNLYSWMSLSLSTFYNLLKWNNVRPHIEYVFLQNTDFKLSDFRLKSQEIWLSLGSRFQPPFPINPVNPLDFSSDPSRLALQIGEQAICHCVVTVNTKAVKWEGMGSLLQSKQDEFCNELKLIKMNTFYSCTSLCYRRIFGKRERKCN